MAVIATTRRTIRPGKLRTLNLMVFIEDIVLVTHLKGAVIFQDRLEYTASSSARNCFSFMMYQENGSEAKKNASINQAPCLTLANLFKALYICYAGRSF